TASGALLGWSGKPAHRRGAVPRGGSAPGSGIYWLSPRGRLFDVRRASDLRRLLWRLRRALWGGRGERHQARPVGDRSPVFLEGARQEDPSRRPRLAAGLTILLGPGRPSRA